MLSYLKRNRLLLLLMPFLLAFLYVAVFGVNVLYWDEWALVRLFEKASMHTLSFNDFFVQHGEHRIFFPRIIFLVIAKLTHYNSRVGMFVVLGLITIPGILYYLKAKTQFGFTAKTSPWWFVLLLFFVFNLAQYQNLLWGFQLSFVMPLTFSMLAFYLIDYVYTQKQVTNIVNAGWFILAIFSAVVASFSSAPGLIVWPVGAFLLMLYSIKAPRQLMYFVSWCFVGIASWIFYFNDYIKPDAHPSLLQHPIAFLEYFCAVVGGLLPTFFHYHFPVLAAIVGVVAGLCILGVGIFTLFKVIKQRETKKYAFWLAVGGYSITVLALISFGRSGFGISHACISRYVTYSIPLIVAIIVLFFNVVKGSETLRKTIMYLSIACISLTLPAGIVKGYTSMRSRSLCKEYILQYKTQSDENLEKIYTFPGNTARHEGKIIYFPDIIRRDAPILEKMKYSSFNEKQ